MEILWLKATNLARIPAAVAKCRALKELNLSENGLRELDREICELPNLMELSLSCNMLRGLPERIKGGGGGGGWMERLEVLDLSNNDLEQFPEELSTLPRLERVNVSGNPICTNAEGMEAIEQGTTVAVYWEYPLPDRVGDGLFVGGAECSRNRDGLQGLGITHIIACSQFRPLHPGAFKYLVIDEQDEFDPDLLVHFTECSSFILQAKLSGGSTLVFCRDGASRSPTIAVAHLMNTKKLTFEQAIDVVSDRHTETRPSPSFIQQLRLYERQLAMDVVLDNAPTSASAVEILQTVLAKQATTATPEKRGPSQLREQH